jgi:hypothetical protein
MSSTGNGVGSVGGRVANVGKLLSTFDRRLLDAFDTLDQLGETARGLDVLSADGEALVADLRERVDRWDAKLEADLAELKSALLAKIGEIEVGSLNGRLTTLEMSIKNIEAAVTQLDTVVEGTVEAAPDFVTRRVRKTTAQVADEQAGA